VLTLARNRAQHPPPARPLVPRDPPRVARRRRPQARRRARRGRPRCSAEQLAGGDGGRGRGIGIGSEGGARVLEEPQVRGCARASPVCRTCLCVT